MIRSLEGQSHMDGEVAGLLAPPPLPTESAGKVAVAQGCRFSGAGKLFARA